VPNVPSLVIAEKPNQARLYEAAVGRGYGPILAARGHLFELAEPEEVNPAWKSWSVGLLRPEGGFYPNRIKPDADAKRRYRAILDAARRVDTIYVATDPDREGEGIGTNIVNALRRDAKWSGRVMRVLPLGMDQGSLRKAFSEARPGEEFRPLYQSFVARQQADQIYNLSLTRSASTLFKPPGWKGALSVGRVLTPTLGLVCRREREIAAFEPEDYFQPWVEVAGAAGRVRLIHAPAEEARILDHQLAQRIASSAAGYEGPIRVRRQRKTQGPPPLFSLAKLQAEAARRFKWPVKRTTDVLQAIYEAKAVTYPRSSEVSLPEAEIGNAPTMLSGILRIPGIEPVTWAGEGPVIRRRKGAFSDADLKGAAHFAIVPNAGTVADWPALHDRMSADERRLFDLIARRYLAAVGPDRVYDSTRQWITVEDRDFAANGTVELVAGWREAAGRKAPTEDTGDEDEEGALPPFSDGDPVRADGTGVAQRQTTPPPRYTDATLVIAMIEAWRHVEEPELRAVLKETDGIGTEATRSSIVANLLGRGLVAPVNGKGGALRATEAGMEFAAILERAAPRLLDVGLTGHLERLLDRIKSGDAKAAAVVNEIVGVAEAALTSMTAAKATGARISATQARAPSEGMKKAARTKAKREGRRVPTGALSDMATCRAFLGPLPDRSDGQGKGGAREPSTKALDLARRIAAERGVELPSEATADARKLSEWIDAHRSPGRVSGTARAEGVGGAPTSKQVGFAERIASRKGIDVPAACYRDRLSMSKWIDAHGAS
jgi:DNA topoisomerase-3